MAKAKQHKASQHKAMRPTWEGHLRLSLVTCPVALYSATERAADVHFNMINPKTNNRIRMQTVDADSIDRIYWDEPYYLAPSGKTGIEAFSVIRAAMEKQSKVALGRLVLHQREHVCALEPRDSGILLTTLRTHDEIRSTDEVFDRNLPKPDPKMLQIAEKIIEQQEAKFDPTEFKDRYEDALRDLIARKSKGEKLVTSEVPEEDDKVVDLMEALKKSLKGGGGPSREKADRFLEAQARKAKPKAKKKASSRKRAA